MDGDKDEMSQFRDGVAFEERCSEVEALLKDIGKAVMEDAAPGKLAKLSQELGFGPESSDDDDEDEEAGQGKADNKTSGQWSGALKTFGLSSYTRRSSFGASLNFGASLMSVMGKKKGMTMKQAAVVIQQWIRGILVRSWLALGTLLAHLWYSSGPLFARSVAPTESPNGPTSTQNRVPGGPRREIRFRFQ